MCSVKYFYLLRGSVKKLNVKLIYISLPHLLWFVPIAIVVFAAELSNHLLVYFRNPMRTALHNKPLIRDLPDLHLPTFRIHHHVHVHKNNGGNNGANNGGGNKPNHKPNSQGNQVKGNNNSNKPQGQNTQIKSGNKGQGNKPEAGGKQTKSSKEMKQGAKSTKGNKKNSATKSAKSVTPTKRPGTRQKSSRSSKGSKRGGRWFWCWNFKDVSTYSHLWG